MQGNVTEKQQVVVFRPPNPGGSSAVLCGLDTCKLASKLTVTHPQVHLQTLLHHVRYLNTLSPTVLCLSLSHLPYLPHLPTALLHSPSCLSLSHPPHLPSVASLVLVFLCSRFSRSSSLLSSSFSTSSSLTSSSFSTSLSSFSTSLSSFSTPSSSSTSLSSSPSSFSSFSSFSTYSPALLVLILLLDSEVRLIPCFSRSLWSWSEQVLPNKGRSKPYPL
jgi:hypothetical protein